MPRGISKAASLFLGRRCGCFVWMQKLDQNGNMLLEITVPNHGAAIRDFTDDGAIRVLGASYAFP